MTGAVDRYNGQDGFALITTHPIANRIVDGDVQAPSFAARIDMLFCGVVEVGIRRTTDLTLAEIDAFRTKQHFWRLMTIPCFFALNPHHQRDEERRVACHESLQSTA